MTAAPTVLGPGSVLGVYQLLQRLAVGGMAEIFLARKVAEAGFEKTVVLKRILPQLAENDEFVHMFLDEARLAAQLHHPNIANVYDIGLDAGSPYFVMEWVQGRDLREVMRAAAGSGGLPLEHAIKIVVSVAAALHHAHERLGPDHRPLGIVHRDVSPSNVLVTYDGGVKLLDFGVAKARSRRTETQAGTLKGKIAYMSPEQCRGDEVDRRSDVFALGIMLYELSTGLPLFSGRNELAMLQEIVNRDAPRPSARIPGYPPALERIVLRALRRSLDERYPTAEELALDLEQFAAQSRLLVSQVELRRYMHQLFPGSIPQRAWTSPRPVTDGDRPHTVILEADLPEDLHTPIPFVLPAPEGGVDAPLVALAPTLEPEDRPTVLPTKPPVAATARRRSRWPQAAALGLVVGALAGVVVLRPWSTGRAPSTTATVAPVAIAPAAPIAPAPVAPVAPAPAPVEPTPAATVPPRPAAAVRVGVAAPPVKATPKKRAGKKKLPARWNPDSPFLPTGGR